MASSLKIGVAYSGSRDSIVKPNKKPISTVSVQFPESHSKDLPVLMKDFMGKPLNKKGSGDWCVKASKSPSPRAQASICISKALRWWDKTLKPNLIEINSAQEFVDSLENAGDKLVIVDFFSPGCGGCKALHPKICQLAELNPNAIFLKVNYEELKTMCHALHIHVLPFFRFYRGAEGKVCSFSCTNATIKKFKDALTKHGSDRCSLGPAKGLDESELQKLASIGAILIDSPLQTTNEEEIMKDLVMSTKCRISNNDWSNASNRGESVEGLNQGGQFHFL